MVWDKVLYPLAAVYFLFQGTVTRNVDRQSSSEYPHIFWMFKLIRPLHAMYEMALETTVQSYIKFSSWQSVLNPNG